MLLPPTQGLSVGEVKGAPHALLTGPCARHVWYKAHRSTLGCAGLRLADAPASATRLPQAAWGCGLRQQHFPDRLNPRPLWLV
jgi:hypothetical protein